jgi:carbamoyl-phosphate synthase large subunit
MALSGRLAGRTSSIVRQCRASTLRTYTTSNSSSCTFLQTRPAILSRKPIQLRAFSTSRVCHNVTQEAPNAQAYLKSGFIAGGRNLVDVKKVLVIGSGGLSIGQAGEFDYSGMSLSAILACACLEVSVERDSTMTHYHWTG